MLNLSVDRRGLAHENDVTALMELREALDDTFANNLAKGKTVKASADRGKGYDAQNVLDGDRSTYWATDDEVLNGSLEVDFWEETSLNRLVLQEYISLGQRVKSFKVEAMVEGNYEVIANETTIGYKRILRLPDTKTNKLRLTILDSKACPTISNIEVYNTEEF